MTEFADQDSASFDELGLSDALRRAVEAQGYEAPTPIQIKTIPLLLDGNDVIGQAQTGTGKTAAFALPILQKIDLHRKAVQALVLTPTRELGIQVAEAVHSYGRAVGEVRVLPVYGGQTIQKQIDRLRSGVQVVVGTPGRIMDHLRRGTLDFSNLKMIILDEADEMLRMGFIEDVEWIMAQAPESVQKALFSATIPNEVRRVADRYLKSPITVEIEHKTLTVPTVQQQYMIVSESQKVDALTYVLETHTESGEAVLVFSRTKVGASELAEKLAARGFAAEAMHGDMNQAQRENVVRRLRNGALEIVIATDVAARGWDVDRIGLVVNYDIPYDLESYVHRIGRTGRAGRTGKAMLFVTPRQKRLLRDLERFTGQRIESTKVPTRADVAARRIALFKERLLKTIESEDLDLYLDLVEELSIESGRDMAEIAAAAARLARGESPLEVSADALPLEEKLDTEAGMTRLFLEVGRSNNVRPSDIVGAIANEADIPGSVIGAIEIYDRYSFVDIPAQYLDQVLSSMDGATIRSRNAKVRVATASDQANVKPGRGFKGKSDKKFFPKGGKKFKKR